MAGKKELKVQDTLIQWEVVNDADYICITDMAKGFEGDPRDYIRNWLRTGATIEFLGVWEQLHNATFNVVEFHHIKSQFTENTFLMSTKKWIERTGAMGMYAKAGRYGGTYAHSDIAIHFANWLNPAFYVYLIKEVQRLKSEEHQRKKMEWNTSRFLSKINYSLQTEAIETALIPRLQGKEKGLAYASEADLINLALFGQTARQWREAHPEAKGNIRDSASIMQLVVLSNLETHNSYLIMAGASKEARYQRLCEIAASQLEIFSRDKRLNDEKRFLE